MRYEQLDGVLHQVVEGRAMLISPAGEEVIVLNGTGTAVWEALAESDDVATLVAAVHAAHPGVAVETISTDVERFLGELVAAGLVQAG